MLTIRPAIEMVVLSSRCSFSIESNCLRKLGRSKSTLNLCGYGFNLVSSLSSEAMNFLRFSKYQYPTASSPPSFFRFGFAPCFALRLLPWLLRLVWLPFARLSSSCAVSLDIFLPASLWCGGASDRVFLVCPDASVLRDLFLASRGVVTTFGEVESRSCAINSQFSWEHHHHYSSPV